MQNRVFIVTGANGHLGSALIRLLKSRREEVRGLVLPGETVADGPLVRYFQGDVTKKESLRPLFEKNGGKELYVVHAAGIVDISGDVSEQLWQVNVGGTRNILDLCREYSVKRLVYISSVHAIPEQKGPLVQREVREVSPGSVVGMPKPKPKPPGRCWTPRRRDWMRWWSILPEFWGPMIAPETTSYNW